MLPGLDANPTPADYVRSILSFTKDNRGRDLFHWWRQARKGTKAPLFGSADIINACNLKCVHCYWWTNREATTGELTPEQWRIVIQNSFKKLKIANVSVVGGEPMLRKDVVQVFSEEMRNRMSVVTNGMFPLIAINGLYFVSIDGTEETHNRIRGPKTYGRIKENVKNLVDAGGRVNINLTLNTLNYMTATDVIREWDDIAGRISIQFHTPFVDDDPLWLPFGEERNKLIDSILEYASKENEYFVVNPKEQLELLRGNWGYKCPGWMILPLDYRGNIKMAAWGARTRMRCSQNATSVGTLPIPASLPRFSQAKRQWRCDREKSLFGLLTTTCWDTKSTVYPTRTPSGGCSLRSGSENQSLICDSVVAQSPSATPLEIYKMVMPWDEGKVIPPTQLDKKRIAVLPFTNMSSNPDDEYFADGVTEELITAMSGLQGLQVIARTSVMNYKKKEKNVSEIGKELGVGMVLSAAIVRILVV
ncbi:MAG: radical SAM protein [Nitrososphaerales archaeon]